MAGRPVRTPSPLVHGGIRADVIDNSHDNVTYNHGQSLVAHGTNITQTIKLTLARRYADPEVSTPSLSLGQPMDTLISNVPRSKHAEFDMVKDVQRGACAPNTRKTVLPDLVAWWRDADAAPVYWMSGIPGTGKTTIVFTFCQYLRERGVLGASFFCSRSLADCQDVYLIFPTIAFQLARKLPNYARDLMEVLRKDPDIHNRSPGDQLQKLIIEPFRKIGDELPTDLAVAVDALDECNGKHSQFLDALFEYGDGLPFKLILTSRPEHVINKSMSTENATSHSTIFILHEVEKSSVQEDITKYLQHALTSLSPLSSTIHLLADRSGGLFIYAATLARFILDENGDPAGRLKFLLAALSQNENVGSIIQALDALYRSILSRVFDFDTASSEEVETLRNVLYTVVYAREPLTRQAIAVLWGLEESTVENRLALLHSVIFVPRDPTRPISTFHASFPDFIMDKARSGHFHCDAEAFNGILALMCFRIMNRLLSQNICRLGGRPSNATIELKTIRSHISQTLSYACIHGTSHLKLYSHFIPQNLKDETLEFILKHALHWLECLSLLGRLAVSAVSLDTLMTVFIKNPSIATLCRETYKFAQANYTLISHSCLEIYHSALIWVPSQSQLRTSYATLWTHPELPIVLRGLPAVWTGPEHIIRGHSNDVWSVAISLDGNLLISGSDDNSVCVWDINSHSLEFTLKGHSRGVRAVAISIDGTWIVSASLDKTVRVWSVANQNVALVLQGNLGWVCCVAISSDGRQVCSGGNDQTVRVWDLRTGKPIKVLAGHSDRVSSVAFTPDCKHIVSGSFDHSARIWEVGSGEVVQVLRGHGRRVSSIAISPSNNHIITGSFDTTVGVWSYQGNIIHRLQGHQQAVYSVTFFRDGRRAASGSLDNTIRIWDIIAGTTLAAWAGHNDQILSIAVSPESLRIVSSSVDNSIAIWTVPDSGEPSEPPGRGFWKRVKLPWKGRERKKDEADGLLAEGTILSAASRMLCMVRTGSILLLNSATLEEKAAFQTKEVACIALSPQCAYLDSSSTQLIRLWNVMMGKKGYFSKGMRTTSHR